ncbi:hypothetical protein J3A83DRAFT_4403014 [Scleroderma citrinum]
MLILGSRFLSQCSTTHEFMRAHVWDVSTLDVSRPVGSTNVSVPVSELNQGECANAMDIPEGAMPETVQTCFCTAALTLLPTETYPPPLITDVIYFILDSWYPSALSNSRVLQLYRLLECDPDRSWLRHNAQQIFMQGTCCGEFGDGLGAEGVGFRFKILVGLPSGFNGSSAELPRGLHELAKFLMLTLIGPSFYCLIYDNEVAMFAIDGPFNSKALFIQIEIGSDDRTRKSGSAAGKQGDVTVREEGLTPAIKCYGDGQAAWIYSAEMDHITRRWTDMEQSQPNYGVPTPSQQTSLALTAPYLVHAQDDFMSNEWYGQFPVDTAPLLHNLVHCDSGSTITYSIEEATEQPMETYHTCRLTPPCGALLEGSIQSIRTHLRFHGHRLLFESLGNQMLKDSMDHFHLVRHEYSTSDLSMTLVPVCSQSGDLVCHVSLYQVEPMNGGQIPSLYKGKCRG